MSINPIHKTYEENHTFLKRDLIEEASYRIKMYRFKNQRYYVGVYKCRHEIQFQSII